MAGPSLLPAAGLSAYLNSVFTAPGDMEVTRMSVPTRSCRAAAGGRAMCGCGCGQEVVVVCRGGRGAGAPSGRQAAAG